MTANFSIWNKNNFPVCAKKHKTPGTVRNRKIPAFNPGKIFNNHGKSNKPSAGKLRRPPIDRRPAKTAANCATVDHRQKTDNERNPQAEASPCVFLKARKP